MAAGLVVVLDANVLYPARLRDLFIRLSIGGMIQAKWSERILDECFDNLATDRPDLDPSRLARTRRLMQVAIPAATYVDGPAADVRELVLPDRDDLHVAATAIETNAEYIVTSNLKDFPDAALAPYAVSALSPDELVVELFKRDPARVRMIIDEQASALAHPPMTTAELLASLKEVGLKRSASLMR